MSRKNYPIIRDAKALQEPHDYYCKADGCIKKAEGVVRVAFSYMRGEDECILTCREHAKGARTNTSAFCNRFPSEAWN